MSCLNPTSYPNPSRYYRPGIDRAFISVPCLKCEACQKEKKNEWAIRAYYEHENCVKSGGFSLMYMLSYTETNIPTFATHSDFDNPDYCFNQFDIEKFTKSLKQFFRRRGEEVKYLICSEYSDNVDTTQRSHLHAISHFYTSLTPYDCLCVIKRLWQHPRYGSKYKGRFVDDTYCNFRKHEMTHGFVSPFKSVEDLIINSYVGVLYSAKYTAKQLDFYNRESLRELEKDPELYERCKHTFPKRFSSYQYGACIAELIRSSAEPCKVLSEGIRYPLSQVFAKIPRYILNKLCYVDCPDGFTENGNKRYHRLYTRFGLEYRKFRDENNIKRYKEHVINVLSEDNLTSVSNYVSDYDLTLINRVKLEILAKIDLLSTYKILFFNKQLPQYTFELSTPDKVFNNTDVELFKNFYYDYIVCNSYHHNKLIKELVCNTRLFNHCPVFYGFDLYLYCIGVLRQFISEGKLEHDKRLDKLVTKIKNFYGI